jgi:hypothetical protein
MSVAVITSIRDSATPALLSLLDRCDPHKVATHIAVRVARHWRDHLAGLPRNKHGYPSTGFWEEAARGVQGVADGSFARVSSDKLGLRLRYYGTQGTPITARNAANLTIPICAEAYGTTVADWGFDNLVLVILADGRKFLALWLGYEESQQAYMRNMNAKIVNGQLKARLTRRAETTAARVNRLREDLALGAPASAPQKPKVIIFRGTGGGTATPARAERHMNIKFLFRLKPEVEQEGNPDVIPSDVGDVTLQAAEEATITAE